jgi:hypothetical protein
MNFMPPIVDTQLELRNYNVPIYGIRGEFSLSSAVKVPYFTCLMDLNRVTQELKTHEEVSPSLDTTYSLIELFQRQIDIERVQREIVDGYLKVPNKIKFFNSLTIVLLPKNQEGKIVSTFDNYENNDPPIPDPQYGPFDAFFSPAQAADKKAVFGGVQFVTTKTENIARLRWDKNRVDAVAVDGQHRLRALKEWMHSKHQQLSDTERPTRIPIIFLMLHEEAGFVGTENGGTVGIKGIAREIFTDLNKNAREVDLATQIILDDLSVESCCVRSLVTKTTCTDDEELLPLTLLRWQEANNRFDQKYYLNSLVNLHLLVKELLGLRAPEPMNKSDVLNFIKNASGLLGTGTPRKLMHQGVPLEDYYRSQFLLESEDEEPIAPFSGIPSHYLPSAVEGFQKYFSPWLLALLKRFSPYAEIIDYARKNNLISGEFGQYLSQPKSHQEELGKDLTYKYGEHWRKIVIDDHSAAIEKIKAVGDSNLGEQWAFKTIFQKAIVRLGRSIFVQLAEDERDQFGNIDDYLYFLNCLYKADILRVHATLPGATHNLWTFIAVNYGSKKIRVTATSEARILGLLTLWYFGWRFSVCENKKIDLSNTKVEGLIHPNEILKYFSTKGSQAKWPTVNDHYNSLLDLFSGSATAQVITGTIEPPKDEAECTRIGKKRLEQVFTEGLKVFVQHQAIDEEDQI